ncbi:MAG: hypothetical protein ABIQ82_13915, partial [Variovorax sp.]
AAMTAAIRAGNPPRAEAVVRELVIRAWRMTREAFIARPDSWTSEERLALPGSTPKRGPGRPRATP